MVERDARRGDADIVLFLELLGEALWKVPRCGILDVGQARDAVFCTRRCIRMDYTGPHEVAHGFGAILIAAILDEFVQFLCKLLIECEGDALHFFRAPTRSCDRYDEFG